MYILCVLGKVLESSILLTLPLFLVDFIYLFIYTLTYFSRHHFLLYCSAFCIIWPIRSLAFINTNAIWTLLFKNNFRTKNLMFKASALSRAGVARIDIDKLQTNIENEVNRYRDGKFPRQSERYYRLMSILHITRLLYHDGLCEPIHREYYRRLAQIHQQQQSPSIPGGVGETTGIQG